MKNSRIPTPPSCNENQFGYLGDVRNEKYFHPKPDVLNIFPVEDDPHLLVDKVLERDLSSVQKIRFDPTNTCNLACVFCTSDLQMRPAQIAPERFREILEKIAPTCRRISVGCGYEPLMVKNIEEYFAVIAEIVETEFLSEPTVNMVSNGVLLNRRNFQLVAPFLSWLHISIHSHRKDNFELIEKKAKYEQFVAGVKATREKFPDLNIHIEFVANALNKYDVPEFIPWAFDELGADSVNVKRVAVSSFHSRSYLADSLIAGTNIGVSDVDWAQIVAQVQEVWPAKLNITPAFSSADQMLQKSASTDVIEI